MGKTITKPYSKSVDPKKSKEKNEFETAQATSAAEAARMEQLKKQPNVEVSEDSKVVTLGVDEYDRWVKEYFELPSAPGYTPNFSRDDFPDIGLGPINVSRCYFNKVDGKFIILDILDENEYSAAQINKIQSTLRAIGFHYAWTIRGEETSLDEIFNTRMKAENKIQPQTKSTAQTNVILVKG